MNGFGYRINDSHGERVDIEQALNADAQLVWVHLPSTDLSLIHI